MTRRIWTWLVVLAVAAVAATGAPAQPPAYGTKAVAKSCSSGFKHAVIGGAQKCLRAGEFCSHAHDSQYRRYGYRCIKYYANVHRYRLTHA
jgi:hypothetical protein